MRAIAGRGYYTEDYGESGFFVGIKLAGQITKAQLISDPQLDLLRALNIID